MRAIDRRCGVIPMGVTPAITAIRSAHAPAAFTRLRAVNVSLPQRTVQPVSKWIAVTPCPVRTCPPFARTVLAKS